MKRKVAIAFLVATLCIIFLSHLAWAGSRNQVPNPGFEIIENGRPTYWGTGATNWEIIEDPAQAYAGQRFIKTWSDDTRPKVIINQTPIPNLVYSPFEPTFRVTARYKTEGQLAAPPVVAIEFWEYKDSKYTSTGTQKTMPGVLDTNGSWETIQFDFNIPGKTNEVWLNLRNFDSQGIVYWDEVEVVWINSDKAFEVSTPLSVLKGGQIPVTVKAIDWDGNVIADYNNQVRLALVDPDGNVLSGLCFPEIIDGFVNGSVTRMITIPEAAPDFFRIKVIDTEEETLAGFSFPIQAGKRNQQGDLVGSRNLLVNGNFEIPNPAFPEELPYLFAGSFQIGQGSRALVVDPDFAYQGQRFTKTVNQTRDDRVGYGLQPIPAVEDAAGRDMKIRYHYRGENLEAPGGWVRVELFGRNADGYYYTAPAIQRYTATGTHDQWQTLEIPFSVPSDTVMLSTDFGSWFAPGTIYWDAVELVWANSQEAFRIWHSNRIDWGEDISVLIEALDWHGQVIPSYFNTVKIVLLDELGNPIPTDAYSPLKAEGFVNGQLQVNIHLDHSRFSKIPESITVKIIDAEEETLTAVSYPITISHEEVRTGSRNFLPNGSFEQVTPPSDQADYWGGFITNDGTKTVVDNQAFAYDGSKAYKTTSENYGDRAVVTMQPINNLEKAIGHQLRARIYYRTENLISNDGRGASVRMEFFGHDGQNYYYTTPPLLYYTTLGTSTEWQLIEFYFVIPENTVRSNFDFGVRGNNIGTVWWDLAEIQWLDSDQAFELETPAQSNSLTFPVTVKALYPDGSILTDYTNDIVIKLFDEHGNELPENTYSPSQYTFQSSQGGVAQIPITLNLEALAALPQSITLLVIDTEEPSLTAKSEPIFMIKEGQLVEPVPSQLLVKVNGQLTLNFQVKDQYDKLMPSEKVQLAIKSGPGSLSQSEVITDTLGKAEVVFQAAGPGVTIVEASLPDFPQSQPVNITIYTVEEFLQTDLPSVFQAGQSVQGEFTLVNTDGQPVKGRTLQFSTPEGLMITPQSGVTDETGSLKVQLVAPTLVGRYEFQVLVVETDYEQNFQIQVEPAEPSQFVMECSPPQEPPAVGISTELSVQVTDRYGNLVADGTAVTLQTSDGQEVVKNTVQGQIKVSFLFPIADSIWIEAIAGQSKQRFDLELPGLSLLEPSSGEVVADEVNFSWSGTATRFRLQISRDDKFQEINYSKELQEKSHTVQTGLPEGKLFWRVMAQNSQVWMTSAAESFILVNVKNSNLLIPFAEPEVLRLDSKNPQVTIPLVLSRNSTVTVSIYDARGILKKRLLNNVFLPHEEDGKTVIYNVKWDGRESSGHQLNNGIYYCLIQIRSADGKSGKVVRRIVIVR